MDLNSFLPVICVILACVILFVVVWRKRKVPASASTPAPAPTTAPTPTPALTPVKPPVSSQQPSAVVIKPVLIYEDTPRNVRICLWCDGENDPRATRCRICAGKLER